MTQFAYCLRVVSEKEQLVYLVSVEASDHVLEWTARQKSHGRILQHLKTRNFDLTRVPPAKSMLVVDRNKTIEFERARGVKPLVIFEFIH